MIGISSILSRVSFNPSNLHLTVKDAPDLTAPLRKSISNGTAEVRDQASNVFSELAAGISTGISRAIASTKSRAAVVLPVNSNRVGQAKTIGIVIALLVVVGIIVAFVMGKRRRRKS